MEDTSKLFQNQKDQIRLQKDFKEYLLSDTEYINEFIQQKRQQSNSKINASNQNQENEEQKQNEFQISREQSQLSQANKDEKNSHQSKFVDMDNLVLVINEQSGNSMEEIKKYIHQHPGLLNVIHMSHFMNMNKFNSYDSFFKYLDHQLEDLEEFYNKNKKQKSLEHFHQMKDYIQTALKGKTKIILFKEYKYNTIKIDQLNIDVPLKQNPQITFVYYVIAAKDIPDFDEIANRLHYYHKSSPYSIYSNIQQRLKQITFNTIKDAIRLSLAENLQENKKSDDDGIHSIQPNEYKVEKLDMWNNLEDCKSLVYKNICSYGLLPINVYLNNQDLKKLQKIKQKAFDFIFQKFKMNMPYPPRFHLNIQIMDKFYSYANNSIFNTYDIEFKQKFLSFYYTKIRVLDYYPLDSWVEKLAANFQTNIIPQIKNYFQMVFRNKFRRQNEEILNDIKHYYLNEIMNNADTIKLIKDISYQFLKEYFSELKIFQKWSYLVTNSESQYKFTDNNCQTAISELITYITNVFEDHYESCDEAYNLKDFVEYLKIKSQNFSYNSQIFLKRFQSLIDFQIPFKNSIFNIQKINISEFSQEENIEQIMNDELLKQYQKFSSSINKEYLDTFMEPLILETPIPKYKYFCEQSHKKYIELIQNGENEIEKLFKVVDEFLESQNSENKNNKQFDDIKEKLTLNDKEKNNQKYDFKEQFNKTHQIIINLIQSAQNYKYGLQNIIHEENNQTPTKLQNIISVLMSVYDSWYFQRKGRVNLSKDQKIQYYKQYQVKDILNELSYYYYNSVRLANEVLFKSNDQFSIIGHLLIKNPAKEVD
ncbi:hypothetical protein ABPG73_015590 [Tetrahymena malaccensis]